MRYVILLSTLFLLCACSLGVAREKGRQVEEHGWGKEYCSGQMSPAELSTYSELLVSILKGRDPAGGLKDDRLFAENVTLIDGGKTIRLKRQDIARYLGKLPTLEDWEVISAALAAGRLRSVGWRGCILSNGKAVFVADGSGHIGLSAFDFDRPWR